MQSQLSNRQHEPNAHFIDASDLNLIEAQHSRAIVDVAIDGISGNFQSVILQVDADAGSILIDELFPAGFVGLPGQPMTINVRRLDGSRSNFTAHVIERFSVDGIDNYRLKLPPSIGYAQRREVFRLRLAWRRAVVSEFQTADQQFCAATVQDLSSTGIRLELQNTIQLTAGDEIRELDFEFEQHRFQCQASVRHVYSVRSGKLVIGAAFHDFPRLQQRLLERLIMQQQRQAVRQSRAAKNGPPSTVPAAHAS